VRCLSPCLFVRFVRVWALYEATDDSSQRVPIQMAQRMICFFFSFSLSDPTRSTTWAYVAQSPPLCYGVMNIQSGLSHSCCCCRSSSSGAPVNATLDVDVERVGGLVTIGFYLLGCIVAMTMMAAIRFHLRFCGLLSSDLSVFFEDF
jgi:hypothetical protein